MPVNNLSDAERSLMGGSRPTAGGRNSALSSGSSLLSRCATPWRPYLDAVPAEVTDPEERVGMARQARRADMQALALKSARVRRGRQSATA